MLTVLVLWLFSVIVSSVTAAPRDFSRLRQNELEPGLVLSPGAIISKLPHIPFEDHAVITFSFNVPTLQAGQREGPCAKEQLCDWETHLSALTDTLSLTLEGSNPAQEALTGSTPNPRGKRSFLSLAAVAVPTLIEYFPKLMQLFKAGPRQLEQSKAVVQYNADVAPSILNLPRQLASAYKALSERKNWGTAQDGIMTRFEERMIETNIKMKTILQLNTLDQSSERCELGYLSPRLVKMIHLNAALEDVSKKISTANGQLLIPRNNLSAYYNVKGATCMATAEKFMINFRVPITRVGETPQLFNLHPAPYKLQDARCLFMRQPMQVAMFGDRPFFLPPNFCKEEDFFCAIPRDSNPSELDGCLLQLFPNVQFAPGPCVPKCTKNTAPEVIQHGDSEFWLITDDDFPLEIRCPYSRPIALTNIEAGADLLTLPCACSITYGSMTLVSQRILCDDYAPTDLTIRRAVPVQWTGRSIARFNAFGEGAEIPVLPEELEVHSEKEVPMERQDLPPWAHESIGAVVGALVGSLIAACAAACRWCRRVRNKRRNRRQREQEQIRLQEKRGDKEGSPKIPVRRYLERVSRGTDMGIPLRHAPPQPAVEAAYFKRGSQYLSWEDLD